MQQRSQLHQTATAGDSGEIGKFGAVVRAALARAGLTSEVANKYAVFAMEIYRYILQHPKVMSALKGAKAAYDVFDNSKKAIKSAGYIERGSAIGLSSANAGFNAYGASGAAGVLQVFVDRFEKLAETQGIHLNDCSMALVKVDLDIAAAGVGSVTALSGVGLVLAGLAVLATAKDGYALGQLLFARGQSR
jgi:hypothetical protein